MDDMGTEYVYPPEKWVKAGMICAAEEQFSTHAELDAAVSDMCDVQDELEARIVALEAKVAWLHSQVRPELPMPQGGNTYQYMRGYADGKAAVVRTEGDYAHIPAAEWEALCAELEQLRAKWASVPWGAIKRMLGDIGCAERANLNSTMDDFSDVLNWWIANAPQEAAE